jgi:hypothetical protein
VSNLFENRIVRPVRIVTDNLTVDGLLNISLGARTLDELNLTSRPFLVLSDPILQSGAWDMDEGPVVINKSFIVFVLEIPDLGAKLSAVAEEPEMRQFARAALRLRTRDHSIEGYIHSGAGSSSLVRLNQATHPFMAIQSVTVKGPGGDFGAPFLAVNRGHIVSAQEMFNISAVPEEVAVTSGDASS